MRARGGLGDGMAIATLIAAGRLDDRLIDRALGMLRELDPGAAFLHWIDEGDAADLHFAGKARDARWALDGLEGVDIVVQPDEPRWKRLLVWICAISRRASPAHSAAEQGRVPSCTPYRRCSA